MTFLNPLLLVLLPMIALPVLIHLINQRRHRTVHWGAMMFLLSAKRMSKGMARLRQFLIMLARMLAIAGLIFAVGRPLATGWFGALTGGKPECVIVLLDRSSSMQQQKLETGQSKQQTGLNKIVDMVRAFEGTRRLVLIESVSNRAIEIESAKSLIDLPKTSATDSSADIPGMMQTALEFMLDNQTGRTDIWICSDGRENDWDPESSRWASLNSQFAELSGVRFHLLNYAESPKENLSVVVERVERTETPENSELSLDIRVRRTTDLEGSIEVPLELSINGVRSVVNIRLDNTEYLLSGHRVVVERENKMGWGKVELPADSNPGDNTHYFCFAEQPAYKTVIVSDEPNAVNTLKIVCSTATDLSQQISAEVVGTDQLTDIEWASTALLLWQAPLPEGQLAKQVSSFLRTGRPVIFFPPDQVDQTEFQGARWGEWNRSQNKKSHVVGFWRNEDDLLQKTMNGSPLPLDEIKVYQYCSLQFEGRTLAKLTDGDALVAKAVSDDGDAYFCSTLPVGTHSSLDRNGIVIYAMIHRALSKGVAAIGLAKMFDAGSQFSVMTQELKPLSHQSVSDQKANVLADQRPYRAGVYGNDEQLVALNRPLIEDSAVSMSREQVEGLFAELDFFVIDDQLGSLKSLASEVWKLFIVLMGVALLAEVVLCLPPKPEAPIGVHTGGRNS